jgi:hypothetical protein
MTELNLNVFTPDLGAACLSGGQGLLQTAGGARAVAAKMAAQLGTLDRAALDLATLMHSALVRFVADGDPGWERFGDHRSPVMIFAEPSEVHENPLEPERAIRGPVRIWSVDGGPDEQALAALEARDFGSLNRLVPEPADERLQLRDDLDAALARLREVRDKYWDRDWRREHRGYGRYPENELWDAVEGYLDLLDTARSRRPDT